MTHRFEICIDANDPDLLRPFWSVALGYSVKVQPEKAIDLVDPSGHGPAVWFQQVPETKTIKNRLHIDIWLDSVEEADILRSSLADLGSSTVEEHPHFVVLRDPEGNEVCLNWPDN